MRRYGGQSLSEYSIFLAVILLAFAVMTFYVRRGLQGRYADLVDFTAKQASPCSQYEPYYIDEDYTVTQERNIGINIGKGGVWQRTDFNKDETVISGESTQNINYYDDE